MAEPHAWKPVRPKSGASSKKNQHNRSSGKLDELVPKASLGAELDDDIEAWAESKKKALREAKDSSKSSRKSVKISTGDADISDASYLKVQSNDSAERRNTGSRKSASSVHISPDQDEERSSMRSGRASGTAAVADDDKSTKRSQKANRRASRGSRDYDDVQWPSPHDHSGATTAADDDKSTKRSKKANRRASRGSRDYDDVQWPSPHDHTPVPDPINDNSLGPSSKKVLKEASFKGHGSVKGKQTEDKKLPFKKVPPLPGQFLKFGCCAVSCCHCDCDDVSSCIQCTMYSRNFCLKSTAVVCKNVGDEDTTCIINQSTFEVLSACDSCECFRQVCCFQAVGSLCCRLDEAYNNAPSSTRDRTTYAKAADGDLTICQGCICCLTNSFCKFPDYCGVSGYCGMCCIQTGCSKCKPVCFDDNRMDRNQCCVLNSQSCYITPCTTCCKSEYQILCCEQRCALPVDDSVPVVCTLLPFCTAFIGSAVALECCVDIAQAQNIL